MQSSRIVILGEPGAGKSTEAHAAVRVLLESRPIEFIPVFGELRGFRGNLRELLGMNARHRRILNAVRLSRKPLRRASILDGLDEVPSELVSTLATEIGCLLKNDQEALLVLTSRQAFYESQRQLFEQEVDEFYLLDLTDDDIRIIREAFRRWCRRVLG